MILLHQINEASDATRRWGRWSRTRLCSPDVSGNRTGRQRRRSVFAVEEARLFLSQIAHDQHMAFSRVKNAIFGRPSAAVAEAIRTDPGGTNFDECATVQ